MKSHIQSIMTPHPSTVFVADSLEHAYQRMISLKVRHLPVVNGQGKLVGILSDRDFQRVMNRDKVSESEEHYSFDARDTVEEIMSWPVQVIPESTTVRTAARLMLQDKLSALVITSLENRPKGIVTTDDLLRYLVASEGPPMDQPISVAASMLD